MRAYIIYILILIATAGCSKKVTKSHSVFSESKTADSTIVKHVTEKTDSTVITPGTHAEITINNPCDSSGKLIPVLISLKQGKSKTSVDTRNGNLVVTSDCDSTIKRLQRELQIKDSAYKHTDTNVQREANESHTVVYRIPLWCWLTMIGLLILAAFSSYCFFKTLFIKI